MEAARIHSVRTWHEYVSTGWRVLFQQGEGYTYHTSVIPSKVPFGSEMYILIRWENIGDVPIAGHVGCIMVLPSDVRDILHVVPGYETWQDRILIPGDGISEGDGILFGPVFTVLAGLYTLEVKLEKAWWVE